MIELIKTIFDFVMILKLFMITIFLFWYKKTESKYQNQFKGYDKIKK